MVRVQRQTADPIEQRPSVELVGQALLVEPDRTVEKDIVEVDPGPLGHELTDSVERTDSDPGAERTERPPVQTPAAVEDEGDPADEQREVETEACEPFAKLRQR